MSKQPFLFAFLSLFVLIGIAISARGLYLCFKAQQTKGWEKTKAELISVNLKEKTRSSRDDDGNTTTSIVHQVKARYSYQYNGEQYFGNRVIIGAIVENISIYEKLKSANAISVFVNPENPTEAVIINTIDRNYVIVILIGFFWAAITLMVMISKFQWSFRIYNLILVVGLMVFYLCHYHFQWGHIYLENFIEVLE